MRRARRRKSMSLAHFVGVGGYLFGAGFSVMIGEYGFAVDHMVGATVVLADGRIVKTSAREEP
jgi:FAD/FMN-containing dehydrogenase